MMQRQPGYYWTTWTGVADPEVRRRWPHPMVGKWDGRFWWYPGMDAYKFDREIEVISEQLAPQIETRETPGLPSDEPKPKTTLVALVSSP